MSPEDFKILNEKCPFLTYVKFQDEEFIGIVQNSDSQIVSVYVYSDLTDHNEKCEFLQLGQEWWENSNHQIPIDIFLKDDFRKFQKILKCLPRKDITDIVGPMVSLEEIFQKRIKRRRIQLIRKID